MNKCKVIFNMINDIWKVISKYKEKDVSRDKECKQLLDELQGVCDSFRSIGEAENELAVKISHLFLEYLCREDSK